MALTNGRDVLRAARAGGYAVPAFNIFNLEMLQAAFRAAEAELGQVGHASHEQRQADLTDPEEASRFVSETGVDALAVAIGTVHGMTETGAVLDIDRIADLARQVDAALVMHGSSGVDDDTLQQAIDAGIRKVNLSTALQRVFMETLRQSASAPGHETDARGVLGDARDAVMEAARHRIRLVGATGRA